MREWATGPSQTVKNYPDNGAINTVTGVLTTDTEKSGAGLTGAPGTAGFTGFAAGNGANGDDDWDFNDGLYPQLKVFSDAQSADWGSQEIADMVKAYSQASVSTAFCNTYENGYDGNTLPVTTYDTVRDLTQKVPLTQESNTVWAKGNDAIGAPEDPTVNLYGKTLDVCTILQNGDQYTAANFAPGIQWLNVKTTVNNQVGQRSLRLVPTANLNVGMTKTVNIGDKYNHAEDVFMAYSTSARMNADATDITQGVYPDNPLGNAQKAVQNNPNPLSGTYLTAFNGANDQYHDVNVGHMALNKAHTTGIASNATYTSTGANGKPGGVMEVVGTTAGGTDLTLDNGTTNTWNDRFNGALAFDVSQIGTYELTYSWVLADGRYLQGSKMVIVISVQFPLPAEELKMTGYDMTDGENGNNTDPSCAGLTTDKFAGSAYVDGNVWLTPNTADMAVKIDNSTGTMTGYTLPDVGASANRYAGNPVYDARNLWFAPADADVLLKTDPGTGVFTIYDMTTGVNGNATMPDASVSDKFYGGVFDGSYVWLVPANSDSLVRVNPNDGSMTGFPLSGGTNMDASCTGVAPDKFHGGVFDGTNIWLVPYNSDKIVKVGNLGPGTPTIEGFSIAVSGPDASATTDDGKYCGGVSTSDGLATSVWMAPAGSDQLLKLSDLGNAIPTITGYDLSDGVNGNVNMTGKSSGTNLDKYSDIVYDKSSLWLIPATSDRVVHVDPATAVMSALAMPYYKSLTSDLPYDQNASDNFHNYYNNNNWGMTEVSVAGSISDSSYIGGCFDGSYLWLSPAGSDRVVKISPSVDETLSVTGANQVTANLTNDMLTASPNSTIDKIEWLRVDTPGTDTEIEAQIANLTYKGNTISPYIDPLNTTVNTSDGFDYAYANAAAEDKGMVVANAAGGMDEQTLSFTAPSSGTYYVKAYFTDPANVYGGDPQYDIDRGTPEMVCVIKQVTIPIVTLHIRQVLLPVEGQTSLPSDLDLPVMGYMTLTGSYSANPDVIVSEMNITTISSINDSIPQQFSTYQLDIKTGGQYKVTAITPQYFNYVGSDVTYLDTDLPHVAPGDPNPDILVDYAANNEAWVTIYFRLNTNNPQNNEVDEATNPFGDIDMSSN
jgi:hypothetical protein